MQPTVFVHTNHRQYLGALVSAYSLRRNSRHADAFDVRIIQHRDHPFLAAREGEWFLRDGTRRRWRNDDLQSFTPLRFMPPELMGYEGRAVVIDPDIFAVGDIHELLTREMEGKAILCRPRSNRGPKKNAFASSVMLLDCARLRHWRCEEQFGEMFRFERDYMDWISLRLEPRESIGLFENVWNDFDHLTEETRLLHNTKRRTQPWKTGLPADYVPAEKFKRFPPLAWLLRLRRRVFGDYAFLPEYASHPDPGQERFFFGLLRECVDRHIVSEDLLREEMGRNHLRHDALQLLDRIPPLAA
jgi:hypothetical protein